MKPERLKIEISLSTFFKLALVIGLAYLVILLKDVLVLIFIVLILVAAFRPVIKSWSKRIGRVPSVLALLLIMLTVISAFVYVVFPPLIPQSVQLIDNLPSYAGKLGFLREHLPSLENGVSSLLQGFGNIGQSFISFTTTLVGGVVSFFTIIVLTLYFLLDEKFFSNNFGRLIPANKRELVVGLTDKVSQKIGNWMRGQLILGLIIGTFVYIVLSLIGIPYALTLAVIAGVLEFLPIIGPVLSAVIGGLVALTISPLSALFTIIFYIILQQVENNLIVPKIMQKAVGLPPAIIIVAILIGGKLLGITGALLAVPVSGILFVLYEEWDSIRGISSDRD
ncbi:MAG: AI-2E family transporter [Patescibacteria group bacterium]|jgi:predicted PurR-regulated permease PerM